MCEVAVDPSIFGCHTSRMPRLLLHKSIRFITIHTALNSYSQKNSWNPENHLFEKHKAIVQNLHFFLGVSWYFCRDPWQADDATKVLKTIEARYNYWDENINVGGLLKRNYMY